MATPASPRQNGMPSYKTASPGYWFPARARQMIDETWIELGFYHLPQLVYLDYPTVVQQKAVG